jgi:hypothetical protein
MQTVILTGALGYLESASATRPVTGCLRTLITTGVHMSITRPPYWNQTFWGTPIPDSSGGGFIQNSQLLFEPNIGDTLVRTRVDFNVNTIITQTGSTFQYDPTFWALVTMLFGIHSSLDTTSDLPPMLNDSGGLGNDWVMWDLVQPRVEIKPDANNFYMLGLTWHINGDVTANSQGERSYAGASAPGVYASLGYFDVEGLLSNVGAAYEASTYINIGVKCLFLSAPS